MNVPVSFPLPDPAFEPLAPLWAAAAAGEFRLPRCTACGRFDWYPTGTCRACGSEHVEWQVLSGRGTLFSWAVVHRALHKPLAPLGSYISAIVAIEEDPSTRFVTRLVDSRPGRLRGDMAVIVRCRDAGYPVVVTGRIVPLFVPAAIEDRDPAADTAIGLPAKSGD